MFVFVSDITKIRNEDLCAIMVYKSTNNQTTVALERGTSVIWSYNFSNIAGDKIYFKGDRIVLEAKDDNDGDVVIVFNLEGLIVSRKEPKADITVEGMISEREVYEDIAKYSMVTSHGHYLASVEIDCVSNGWKVTLDFNDKSKILDRGDVLKNLDVFIEALIEGDGIDIEVRSIHRPSEVYNITYSFDNEIYRLWHRTVSKHC